MMFLCDRGGWTGRRGRVGELKGRKRTHRLRNTRLRHLDIAWLRADRDVDVGGLRLDDRHGVVGGGGLLCVSHFGFLF